MYACVDKIMGGNKPSRLSTQWPCDGYSNLVWWYVYVHICVHIYIFQLKNIEIDEKGNIIAKISVAVDGTWQKRGHSSKIGTVFVISVQTGEVLDYIVKSLVCHTCMKRQQDDKTSKDYIN